MPFLVREGTDLDTVGHNGSDPRRARLLLRWRPPDRPAVTTKGT